MSALLTPLTYVLAFAAVVIFVQAAAGLLFSASDQNRRINRRLTMLDAGMTRDEVYKNLIRQSSMPNVRSARLASAYAQVELYCRQAGLSVTPVRLLVYAALGAGALWLVALSIASSGGDRGFLLNGMVSLVAAIGLSLLATWLWVRRLRNRRLKKVEEQLPLALDIITRAVRAGHPVISAVQLAADELGDPVGSEFGLIIDETTYGVEFREALANCAHRTGSADAHFFAVSVSIQSETGGNLAEILEGLANVMRGRATLALRVRSLASEGRASAILVSVLPLLLLAMQLMIRPRIYTDKFSDPMFWPAVGIAGLLYLGGWLGIRRIINFKY
jgi:tight adherence protein B